MIPLGRQYHASVVNTDLDVYKIKDKVMGVRTSCLLYTSDAADE